MRRLRPLLLTLAVCVFVPALSDAQSAGSLQGFGGLSVSGVDSIPLGGGATVTFPLTAAVHVVGEAGRMGNVLPPVTSSLFSLFDTGVSASAFYAEGGVRFFARPGATASPYAEATAGVARLDLDIDRLGGLAGTLTNAALGALGRTGPIAGVGGGMMFRTGRVVFDVGYRYKQVFPPEPLGTVLGLGQDLRSHQVRAGVGVAF